jgi:hypothetical protein
MLRTDERVVIIDISQALLQLCSQEHLRIVDARDGISPLILTDGDNLGSCSWWLQQISLFIRDNQESIARMERLADWLLTRQQALLILDTQSCRQTMQSLTQFSTLNLSSETYVPIWYAAEVRIAEFNAQDLRNTLHIASYYRGAAIQRLINAATKQLTPSIPTLTVADLGNIMRSLNRSSDSFTAGAATFIYRIADQFAGLLTSDNQLSLLCTLKKLPATRECKNLVKQLITTLQAEELSLEQQIILIHAKATLQLKQLTDRDHHCSPPNKSTRCGTKAAISKPTLASLSA